MEALRVAGFVTEEGTKNFKVEQGVLECIPCASEKEASQLLLACGGLWEPAAGTVEVFGRNLYRMDAGERAAFRRRNIGVVSPDNNLLAGLNLYENVVLSLELDGRQPDLARAECLTRQTGLTETWDCPADRLSPAKRQIAAIIRSVLAGDSLILVKLSQTAPAGQVREVMRALRLVQERYGLTAAVFAGTKGQELPAWEEGDAYEENQ